MITPQDGSDKQDCERNAGKRWLDKWSHLFTPDSITYLGDDLFCNQPFCEQVIANNQYFSLCASRTRTLSCLSLARVYDNVKLALPTLNVKEPELTKKTTIINSFEGAGG